MLEYREPSEHQVCIHFCRNRIEIARSHSYKVMLFKVKKLLPELSSQPLAPIHFYTK